MKNIIVYDLEIIKAIPPNDGRLLDGIDYCRGWQDHASMGVSVIGAYDFNHSRYRVFTKDNWAEFAKMVEDPNNIFAGFNSIHFDNTVLRASGIVDIKEDQSYDLLREIWIASDLGITFKYPSHAGYSLDAVAIANGFKGKTGNGAYAPVDWQRGNIGTVIDYCLQDVAITAKLINKVIQKSLHCPKTNTLLNVRAPI